MEVKRVLSTIERKYIKNNLKNEKRLDGRGLWDYRKFSVSVDTITSAEGSSDVCLGDSRIITGLKYEVGDPFPDTPDEGVCTIMAELLPLASPLFESGPPDDQAIELARVVDRGIRHADCIQTKRLCIKEGKCVYIIYLDMYVIHYSGNLIDCGGVGTLAALISSYIPAAEWKDDKAVWNGQYLTGEDIVKELPLVITFGKIDDILFVDPSLPEELIADGSISISVTENKITSIQKSGIAMFSIEELKLLSKKAIEIGQKLRNELNLKSLGKNY